MSIDSPARSTRAAWNMTFATLLLVPAGCTEHVTEGNQSIYQFSAWVGPAEIAFCSVLIVIGWWLRKRYKYFGYPAMLLGTLFILILPGASFHDRVVVDDEHFEATYGFWFNPNQHNIRFKELREIRYTYVFRRRGSKHYQLRCLKQSGETEIVHVGDLVTHTVAEILRRAKDQGVTIVDHSQ